MHNIKTLPLTPVVTVHIQQQRHTRQLNSIGQEYDPLQHKNDLWVSPEGHEYHADVAGAINWIAGFFDSGRVQRPRVMLKTKSGGFIRSWVWLLANDDDD
ncbi:hypothetical protein Hypma_012124 [Hypsizygus marmoreus]|uniref:Uncharacterized protein n=1 Tax=Hypsizygus marmoreus TaxID=39966 RepID=A0A369JHK0_HYPMA|nr:hypothetical protein Hypma_012124 [Hypsizygus marmoreus]